MQSVECPSLLNEDVEKTSFDFCCYSKLSKGETINICASKALDCLESNKLLIPHSNIQKRSSSLTNTSIQTFASKLSGNDEPTQNFVELSALDNSNKNKFEPTPSLHKDPLKNTQFPKFHFNENEKINENIVESNDVKDTLGDPIIDKGLKKFDSNENKDTNENTVVSNNVKDTLGDPNIDKGWNKIKKLSKPKLLYEFDVFLTPNYGFLSCSNSEFF